MSIQSNYYYLEFKIDELKYLNTKDCNNFEYMFFGCSSLSDIKGLENGMYQMVIILKVCSVDVHHYQILKD